MHDSFSGGQAIGKTVGLLIGSVSDPRDAAVWAGAVDAALASGAGLVCFECRPGGDCSDLVCRLVSSECVDGLIVGIDLGQDDLSDVLPAAVSLPTVALDGSDRGVDGITLDYAEAMRTAVHHLIEVHRRGRVALIVRETSGHADRQHLQAYVSVLQARGLAYDPDLVIVGDEGLSSDGVIRTLFDERSAAPDALVATCSEMAFELIDGLVRRGLRVPQDVSIVALSDEGAERSEGGLLATVTQPWAEVGRRAVEALLAHWGGDAMPGDVVLQARLRPGLSCGCVSSQTEATRSSDPEAARWDADRGIDRRSREAQDRILRRLAAIASLDDLSAALREDLSRCGIPRAFVWLSEDRSARPGWARLVGAYDVDNSCAETTSAQPISATQLVPAGSSRAQTPRALLVQRLYARGQEIGHVVFEAGSEQGALLAVVSPSLGPIVDGLALVQHVVDQLASALETSSVRSELPASLAGAEALGELGEQIRRADSEAALLHTAERAVSGLLRVPVRIEPVRGPAPRPTAGLSIEVDGITGYVLTIDDQKQRSLSVEERGIVQQACRQIGDALSRLRLLEQAATRAEQERVVGEIVRKIEQAPDLQSLMRIAADELSRALRASHAYIRMGTEDELLGR
ncbi:MAG: LacI family DNA-binding transcriptional regulator [Anaerolineae bacterium]|nr:LacI family DNA-binding transcriptional regulator [Anaerolineae bacterium]